MKLCKCNIVEELEISILPNIILEHSKDSGADLGNLIILELNKKLDKEDLNLETDNKTVVGGINEVYNTVPPFASFEQNEDGTYTIVLPHKSVYALASESSPYILVSLPNECFEDITDFYCDLVMPLSSGVESNEDGEDTKTLTIYL